MSVETMVGIGVIAYVLAGSMVAGVVHHVAPKQTEDGGVVVMSLFWPCTLFCLLGYYAAFSVTAAVAWWNSPRPIDPELEKCCK